MNKQKWLVFWVVLALVGGTGAYLNKLQASYRLGNPGLKMVEQPVYDETGKVVCTNTVDLPVKVLDYISKLQAVTLVEKSWLPTDTTYGKRRYTNQNDGSWIDVSVVLMGKDRTSIHPPEICLDGQGWKIDRSELLMVPIPKPRPYDLPVMKLTADKMFKTESGQPSLRRALYVYWFVSENRITARHSERMWWMAKDLLATGVLPRWAYIAYFSVCQPGQEEATFNRMKEFMAASVPEFQIVHGLVESASPASASVTAQR